MEVLDPKSTIPAIVSGALYPNIWVLGPLVHGIHTICQGLQKGRYWRSRSHLKTLAAQLTAEIIVPIHTAQLREAKDLESRS